MNALVQPELPHKRTATPAPAAADTDLPASVRALQSETLHTLRLALELYQQPQHAAALRRAALPNAEFDLLLHCAAGTAELSEVAAVLRTPPQTLQSALDFYLVQVLFVPAASAWRVLGLHASADARQVREHARLMLLWLARTRAQNPLVALHIAQVRRAQQDLRQQPPTGEYSARTPPPALQPGRVQQARAALRPTHTGTRALRLFVLALIGVALALGLLWLSRQWHAAPLRMAPAAVAPALTWPAALPLPPPRMHIVMPALAQGISMPAMRVQTAPMPQPLAMVVPEASMIAPLAVAWPPLRQTFSVRARVRAAPLLMPRPALPSLRLPIPSAATPAPQRTSVSLPVTTTSPAPAADTTAIARLLRTFSDSYARGDLSAFMALFAPQVRDGTRDFAALRETYTRLFAGSESRSLHLSEVRIAPASATRARVLLRYEARVLEHGAATPALYRGALALDMQSEHGNWRIVGLRRLAATTSPASAARSE
ncbi:MAG: YybH family protein [Metallibacterium sp.]